MNISIAKDISKSPLAASLKSSSRSLSEGLILIVITTLFYFYIIQPKKVELAAAEVQKAKFTDEQKNLDSNVKKLEELISKMKSHKEDVRHLDESLPLSGRSTRLHLLLEKIAGDAGLNAPEINLSQRNDKPAAGDKTHLSQPFTDKRTLQIVTGSIFVVGGFDNLKSFLKMLENNGRLINITDVDITADKSRDLLDNGPVQLNLKVNLEAYYYE